MAQTKHGEIMVNTIGELPTVGNPAPEFLLTGVEMKDIDSSQFRGKSIVLNIFPSVDTRVCAMSVREFNKRAASLTNTVVLCISKDLPFAFRRFCGAEGIENVITLSGFRGDEFGKNYGVELLDGRFAGLYARAVVVIAPDGIIRHSELVPAIGLEPNYDQAIAAVESI